MKKILIIHIIATFLAISTIAYFFISSSYAEITENEDLILKTKTRILFLLPILIISMPVLGITGSKMSKYSKKDNPLLLAKKKRMKYIIINGFILIFLAISLYYYSHFVKIDNVFFIFQSLELLIGFTNIVLIICNIKDGFSLSKKYQ